MMTATSGFASTLLPLRQRESLLAVERLQVRSLHDLQTGSDQPLQHAEDLSLCHDLIGGEAAAEAIGAEGLRHAVGPDLYAAIVDHAQRQAVSVAALGSLAELLV